MSIILKKISYIHPDRELLFRDLSFTIAKGQKAALVGNNGSGKSTLMQIIANNLRLSSGEIVFSEEPYYVPQHFGQYDRLTVSQALRIDLKVDALHAILEGDVSAERLIILDDDWSVEERALGALAFWGLEKIKLTDKMESLSGGEKTKVFLSGIAIHSPSIVLLDEPSNHLDLSSRNKLYKYIQTTNQTILLVSHDRTLLNLLDITFELCRDKIETYGGNYEFYKAQKGEQQKALEEHLRDKEKELRNAKRIAREAAERKQRQDVRGKKKQEKAGVARIALGMLKDKAEASSAKLKDVHSDKIESLMADKKQLQKKVGEAKELKLQIDDALLREGKILYTATGINYAYDDSPLWKEPLSFQLKSGERWVIQGENGSGKSTLLKLILGLLEPTEGNFFRSDFEYLYIDQEYSIIDKRLTVYEQVEAFNSRNLLEHELKTLLHRYLFTFETWNKTCDKLSGGEKMKLVFCCMMVSNNAPDLFVLDEPTNNLDIESLDIITSTIKDYRGTLIVISHDQYFLDQIGIEKSIQL